MKPITGSASITEQPDASAEAGPPYTYLGVAENLMPRMKILAAASPAPVHALAFLAAHVLECLLKAYLSRGGSDDAVKRRNKHDLNALWAMVFKQGLGVTESPPSWADRLSYLHKGPCYYLRYSGSKYLKRQGGRRILVEDYAHGIVPPGAEPMTSELGDLLGIVRRELGTQA
jgi:hypothetical protein